MKKYDEQKVLEEYRKVILRELKERTEGIREDDLIINTGLKIEELYRGYNSNPLTTKETIEKLVEEGEVVKSPFKILSLNQKERKKVYDILQPLNTKSQII